MKGFFQKHIDSLDSFNTFFFNQQWSYFAFTVSMKAFNESFH